MSCVWFSHRRVACLIYDIPSRALSPPVVVRQHEYLLVGGRGYIFPGQNGLRPTSDTFAGSRKLVGSSISCVTSRHCVTQARHGLFVCCNSERRHVFAYHTTNEVVDRIAQIKLSNTEAKPAEQAEDKGPSYPFYYPYFDKEEKFPPTELFEHTDAGLRADPKKPNLLAEGVKVKHFSPYLGTELRGVQISQLSKEGLDELALLTAERKVVVFRDQDFKDIGADRQIEIARHFGPIQRHPTSGNVKGYPEFHVVYRDGDHNRFKEYAGGDRANHTSWHSDVSYEKQPPSTTFFFILDQPEVGGDTIFASQVEAYNRLSPEFKKRLEGLRAVHSAVPQAEYSRKRDGPVRREPVETEHPVVRQHPVTGEKALYVNQGFTKYIVGFKVEESEYLLKFLFDHISKGADFQLRASWEPGTVTVWDNRVTVHSATPDFADNVRRHAVRLTPQAEVPIPA